MNELVRNEEEGNGVEAQLKSLDEKENAKVIDTLKTYELVVVKENARLAAEKKAAHRRNMDNLEESRKI